MFVTWAGEKQQKSHANPSASKRFNVLLHLGPTSVYSIDLLSPSVNNRFLVTLEDDWASWNASNCIQCCQVSGKLSQGLWYDSADQQRSKVVDTIGDIGASDFHWPSPRRKTVKKHNKNTKMISSCFLLLQVSDRFDLAIRATFQQTGSSLSLWKS